MKVVEMAVWVLLSLTVAVAIYVRFAPSDAGRWHQSIDATTDVDTPTGAVRVVAADTDGLARIDRAILALPRANVLAGSVVEGRITYVIRSKIVGFPDYVTAEQAGGTVKIFSRLRFGVSDLGVNAVRLRQILSAAQM